MAIATASSDFSCPRPGEWRIYLSAWAEQTDRSKHSTKKQPAILSFLFPFLYQHFFELCTKLTQLVSDICYVLIQSLRLPSSISAAVLGQEHDILHNTGFQVHINGVSSILLRFQVGQFPHEDPTTIAERSIQQYIGRILIHIY